MGKIEIMLTVINNINIVKIIYLDVNTIAIIILLNMRIAHI